MKLDHLLAPYLYRHKKLNLPGIGTFEADSSTTVPEDNDKHHTLVQGITFNSFSNPDPDNELIEYIKTHTGKMKPLAMADLESYLMLVKQFLNIGKPFYIEGIGTLQKTTDGSLKFTPGEYISSKPESSAQEHSATAKRKAAAENANHPAGRSNSRKALLTFITIATVVLIGWGGYYLYTINTNNNDEQQEVPPATPVMPMQDTAPPLIQPDSSMLIKDSATVIKADTTSVSTAIQADTTKFKKPIKKIKKLLPVKTDSISGVKNPPATDTPVNTN